MELLNGASPISDFRDQIRRTEFSSIALTTYFSRVGRSTRRFVRDFWCWACPERMPHLTVSSMAKSLAELDALSSQAICPGNRDEAPIFILSTGWRTGSTLLQRVLVTDPDVLLWGEPFGEMALVSKVAEMVSHIPELRGLKEWTIQRTPTAAELATSWIATLHPPGADFRSAVRSLFDRWLGLPARQRGFSRWGFKEVRLGAAEALFLNWLYPKAKFVLLSRHPYDCYRSLADASWHPLYSRYPKESVDSAAAFARHWNRLALSWSELPAVFPSFHIRYEDLISGKIDFRKLESWLGLKLQEIVALETVVGHTAVRSRLSWHERLIINSEANPGMHALGYSRTPHIID